MVKADISLLARPILHSHVVGCFNWSFLGLGTYDVVLSADMCPKTSMLKVVQTRGSAGTRVGLLKFHEVPITVCE